MDRKKKVPLPLDFEGLMSTLYELLSMRAEERPEDLALASSTLELSFSGLKLAVDSAATRLRGLGVQSQQVILLEVPEFYSWVLTLAVSKLGAISLSMPEGSSPDHFHQLIDFRVSTNSPGSAKVFSFETSWLIPTGETGRVSSFRFSDSDFVRAISTSGSTGLPKLALFTHKSMEARLKRIPNVWASESTEFNFMPLGSTGGFGSAVYSLLSGLPYLVKDTSRESLVKFLARKNVQTLSGSPEQFAVFVANNSENLHLLPSVNRIRLAGASPTANQIQNLKKVFNAEVMSVYGSTETGLIFTNKTIGPDEFDRLGELSQGSDARIVDENGIEVPDGCIGFLETRSESMFSGYLQGSSPTKVLSAPEWFITTDKVVKSNGSYRFLGRDSNILNVGGMKLYVEELEAFARSQEGVLDAVSFVGENRLGRAMHVMAIVASNNYAKSNLIESINDLYPGSAPRVFWTVGEIPRATLDKPARWLLAERFKNEYPG